MRPFLLLAPLCLAALASAQGDPPANETRPDATVVIQKHRLGADMVEVTMMSPDYPVDLLRSQMQKLGSYLDSMPRGLNVRTEQIDQKNPRLKFIKASFALNGIVEEQQQKINLEPILKAFAGAAPPNEVDTILIILDGIRPTARTVRRHDSGNVHAEATANLNPPSIEYLVTLKTQDPEKIVFPSFVPEQKSTSVTSSKPTGTPFLFYGAIALAALAAGALVYLALLRGTGHARR